jgi:PhzF family phenazine biosynthesis protein
VGGCHILPQSSTRRSDIGFGEWLSWSTQHVLLLDVLKHPRSVMTTMRMEIAIYDVFARRPFSGNQAAVVHERGHGFSDTQLIALAGEMSLAETALSSLRGRELTFRFANAKQLVNRCGHASLASVADHVLSRILRHRARHGVWAGRYSVGSAVAEWRARMVRSRGDRISIATGIEVAIAWPDRPRHVISLPAKPVYRALGLGPDDRAHDLPLCVYDSGNLNALVPVRTLASLKRANPDWRALEVLFEKHRLTDVHLYYIPRRARSARRLQLRCRNIFPYGLFEETATGTASVALAAALVDKMPTLRGGTSPIAFLFEQGVGTRRGTIRVNWRPGPKRALTIWLEGRVFPVLTGDLISSPPA